MCVKKKNTHLSFLSLSLHHHPTHRLPLKSRHASKLVVLATRPWARNREPKPPLPPASARAGVNARKEGRTAEEQGGVSVQVPAATAEAGEGWPVEGEEGKRDVVSVCVSLSRAAPAACRFPRS